MYGNTPEAERARQEAVERIHAFNRQVTEALDNFNRVKAAEQAKKDRVGSVIILPLDPRRPSSYSQGEFTDAVQIGDRSYEVES